MQYITLHQPEFTSKSAVWLDLAGPDREMHHIKAQSTISLTLWLESTPCTMPPGPFGYIGCGALVINDENKVLAVRENYVDKPGKWKLPGGLFDPDKDQKWSDAAVRECLEETGIHCEFQFVTVERLMLDSKAMFHRPDFFVVCRCRPLTTEIRRDPGEIAECQWIDPNELIDEGYDFNADYIRVSCQLGKGVQEREIGDYVVYRQEID
jgi:8-oxo-dGTP pyrophosphatase MutT (NUDIX family)